jgi:hypothetical protein
MSGIRRLASAIHGLAGQGTKKPWSDVVVLDRRNFIRGLALTATMRCTKVSAVPLAGSSSPVAPVGRTVHPSSEISNIRANCKTPQ